MNHAQEAKRLISATNTKDWNDPSPYVDRRIAAAHVHATLALAEQQRLANVFELSRIESENHCTPKDALNAIYDTSDPDYLESLPEIMEALELGDPE